jgi:hypothetical protein
MGRLNLTPLVMALLVLLLLSSCTSTGVKMDTRKGGSQTSWPSSTPEKQGVDSVKLVNLLEYIEEQGMAIHSLLVIRNGTIILEAYYYPYTKDQKHILNSCTKSYLSALVGLAIDRGYIRSVGSNIVDFFSGYRIADRDKKKEGSQSSIF